MPKHEVMSLHSHRNIIGFTMIEMMVAVLLGLILTTAFIQVLVNNQSGYQTQSEYVVLQENARFVEYFMNKSVHMAGYRTPPADNSYTIYPGVDSVFSTTTPFLQGSNGASQAQSDTLTIRYQGNADNTVTDCLNVAIGANVTATNVIAINSGNQLTCRSQNPSAATTDSTQVLLDGVESMQLLFGEDTDGDGSVDRFVTADNPNLQVSRVVCIKVGLLLRTTNNLNTLSNTNTYNVLGATVTPTTDRRLRQNFNFTIQLRNIPRYNNA